MKNILGYQIQRFSTRIKVISRYQVRHIKVRPAPKDGVPRPLAGNVKGVITTERQHELSRVIGQLHNKWREK